MGFGIGDTSVGYTRWGRFKSWLRENDHPLESITTCDKDNYGYVINYYIDYETLENIFYTKGLLEKIPDDFFIIKIQIEKAYNDQDDLSLEIYF
jgi:hypothetical protein